MKKLYSTAGVCLVFATLTFLDATARAQAPEESLPRPSIRVTGEATLTAKPDRAEIGIGVVTEAKTAKAAAAENTQRLDAVISGLRKALGPSADIKTTGYSLQPIYSAPKPGAARAVEGYSATNIVQVRTEDLTQVGAIIDLATQSGANKIHSLVFTLKDEQSIRTQALREAAVRAREKADAIASALGAKIIRVLLAEESGPVVRPMLRESFAMAAESRVVPTPVEPGTIEVHATVTLTVEISP
jgi:uncharacterized protein YggE